MKRKTMIALTVALLVGPTVSSADARTGTIRVKTQATLQFPAPSTYTGTLAVYQVTAVRKARHRGVPAPPSAKRRAKVRSRRLCNAHNAATPVQILQTPPDEPTTVIGSDVPGPDHAYSVSGGSPATEDLITAVQERRRSGHLNTGRFRWRFTCQRAEAVKLYPF